ncbi:PAS domain-containing sensor histidine kinase [Legionella sp. km535]|uniref:response regulator n=1 Tax=Legionella sp. km535 TaxID=2498107 RepID=UPI000F8DB1BA|nr:PAS domain-containing sensor histidine kinase [Legionella sp. km535]RUR19990.1 PAS domain-containing sensor histidine kinase [Legionella sp. km535]
MAHSKELLKFNTSFLEFFANQSEEYILILNETLHIVFINDEAKRNLLPESTITIGQCFNQLCQQNKLEAGLCNFVKEYASLSEDSNISKFYQYKSLTWEINELTENNQRYFLIQTNNKKQLGKENTIHNLEVLIENMPCNVYWMDKNCLMVGCNQNVLNMLNLSREEFKGKSYEELAVLCHWPEGLAEKLKNDDLKVIKSGRAIYGIEDPPIPGTKNQVFNFLTSRVPLFDKNGIISGVAGISTDISDLLQEKEKTEVANKAKTEFLENMRHDIRTPLTGIVGFADLLKMESDNPLIKEYSENLVASSHALRDLLDEVLEAIQVSTGEIPKLKKKFNLEDTLNHVIKLNRSKAAQKKIALSLRFDEHIPYCVIGDKVRIHRIALELIANALNFTDSGHVTLSVILAKRHQRELIIKLVVEDSGIGIPKDKQQEIYIQFKRLTPSYQGIYKGVGLGLSVAKQFIDELDGEIYVESESGKGSRFTCVIPLQEPLLDDDLGIHEEIEEIQDSTHEQTQSQEIKAIFQNNPGHMHQVLVVEDNPIAQIVAKSILSKLNCTTDIADTGKNAIEYWKKHHYDLIFMDIGLPDMDGYEITHLIRVHELTKKIHTPIIALTAHAGDENKKRCIDAGMNAVLTKPLTTKNCADIIEAFMPGNAQLSTHKNSSKKNSDVHEQNQSLFDLSPFPILDFEEGIKATGNKMILEKMLAFMLEDTLPKDRQLIQEAHTNLDWDKTQHLAHKIKGGAVYVGTVRLKMACQFIERYYKSGQRVQLESLYQQVLTVIDQTCQEIGDFLQQKNNN